MQEEDRLLRAVRHLILRAPLFMPLLGVVGCLLGGQWWSLTVIALFVSHLARARRIILCTLLCVGIGWVQEHRQEHNRSNLRQQLQEKGYVYLEGTIERKLSRGCILDTGFNGVRVALRGDIPWKTGDRIAAYAEPQPYYPAPIKGMFDTKTWLHSQGLAANLRVQQAEYLEPSFGWLRIKGVAESVRAQLVRTLMPPGKEDDPRRQVLCSLTLGDKSGAEQSVINVFKRGGCLHAFAVSGLHVGIVSGLFYFLAFRLRLSPRTQALLVLILVGLFVMVTGLAVPALRAYVMVALVLIGRELRRRVDMVNIWSLPALMILLIEPWQLGNAGFVLSFAVYAAIGIGVRVCMNVRPWLQPDSYLPRRLYTVWDDRLCKFDYILRGTVIVSFSAWLVSLPITAAFFHTVTPYSFLTNIAISPLLPLVMGSGLLALLLGGVPLIGAAVQWVALKCSSLLIAVVSFFASLPMSYMPIVPQAVAGQGMVCNLGYGESFAVLGNPGLVVGTGSAASARFSTEPSLFFSGYRPAALLKIHSGDKWDKAAAVLKESWPQMQLLSINEQVLHISTEAGAYEVFPPPPDLSRSLAENHCPIVRWHRADGTKVLYVGGASALTWEQLPAESKRADILIVGRNDDMPPELKQLLAESGAVRCILLPDVPSQAGNALIEGVEIERLSDDARILKF
ncbi:MAG: ComEC/Rec2 family competence protein [Akkermansia sp.]|nr:ComEC/Rec2 family competence protein [Akkermansia sp.]